MIIVVGCCCQTEGKKKGNKRKEMEAKQVSGIGNQNPNKNDE